MYVLCRVFPLAVSQLLNAYLRSISTCSFHIPMYSLYFLPQAFDVFASQFYLCKGAKYPLQIYIVKCQVNEMW